MVLLSDAPTEPNLPSLLLHHLRRLEPAVLFHHPLHTHLVAVAFSDCHCAEEPSAQDIPYDVAVSEFGKQSNLEDFAEQTSKEQWKYKQLKQ